MDGEAGAGENGLKYPVFCLASFRELSNVRAFSDRFVWSVAHALNRREKDEARNKLNNKWNLSLAMRVGDDYSPALVFLRKKTWLRCSVFLF
jgi:hypothetical protein